MMSTKSVSQLSEAEIHKLLHELQVHQIELELQNKELILANKKIENVSEKYIELYDFSPSGYFTLSALGEIVQLNLCGAKMLGNDRSRLKDRLFHLFISESSKPVFKLFLKNVFGLRTEQSCELNLSTKADSPFYVLLTAVVNENDENCYLFTVDFKSLYANIPVKHAIELMKE